MNGDHSFEERERGSARLGVWIHRLLRAPLAALLVLGNTAGSEEEAIPGMDRGAERSHMVEEQLRARGIRDPRVLLAMEQVPRHAFVPEALRNQAYADRALPIGHDQTISQPYVVAAMTEALHPEPGDRVLEVGTGSGYQAAILSRLVDRVSSIEIIPGLADRARKLLLAQGCENVTVLTGDGYRGLPEQAPFDGILVTAAPPEVPEALLDQLAVGGRLVIPVGVGSQELRVIEKTSDGFETRILFGVRFVPMVRGERE